MKNALAAYAILIPMLLACGVMFGPSLKCETSTLHQLIGEVLLEVGNYEEALVEFNRAIKADPEAAGAYNDRACALQSLNRDREAIEDCNKSLAIKNDANAYLTRGFSYGHLGDRELQLRDYNTAVQLDPTLPYSYYYRARFYQKQGKIDLARADKEKAKAVGGVIDRFVDRQLKE